MLTHDEVIAQAAQGFAGYAGYASLCQQHGHAPVSEADYAEYRDVLAAEQRIEQAPKPWSYKAVLQAFMYNGSDPQPYQLQMLEHIMQAEKRYFTMIIDELSDMPAAPAAPAKAR